MQGGAIRSGPDKKGLTLSYFGPAQMSSSYANELLEAFKSQSPGVPRTRAKAYRTHAWGSGGKQAEVQGVSCALDRISSYTVSSLKRHYSIDDVLSRVSFSVRGPAGWNPLNSRRACGRLEGPWRRACGGGPVGGSVEEARGGGPVEEVRGGGPVEEGRGGGSVEEGLWRRVLWRRPVEEARGGGPVEEGSETVTITEFLAMVRVPLPSLKVFWLK
ncbi:hypothetical protein NHX12_009657 [Muraenolepis orangiensis]|uniref:Uncharacterized protein n=1 Tax=Muraenolepis orangiensis TaxID=630683 RepID=A0A9Q0DI14_9TELE|nr:hypothetical protein NHX12_009657 [Muraenolepis orangiensis]